MLDNDCQYFLFKIFDTFNSMLYNKVNMKVGDLMTLGEIIKQYRTEHSLSMDAFAERSGISKAYISLLEKNKHPQTGKSIAPSIQCIKQAADGMHIDFNTLFTMIDGNVTINNQKDTNNASRKRVTINVLGRVAAGIPIEAIEEIIDTEEITEELARTGTFFGLKIHGNSMEPKFSEGDVVIVRQQDDAESGDIVIATVNGSDATCKRLKKYRDGIALISTNTDYDPMIFSNEEVISKPVRIIGKVVELRAKF